MPCAQTATFDQEPDFGDGGSPAPYEEPEPYTFADPESAQYAAAQSPSADNVQYVRARGKALHAFQAALAEELTVAQGEMVRTARLCRPPAVLLIALLSK